MPEKPRCTVYLLLLLAANLKSLSADELSLAAAHRAEKVTVVSEDTVLVPGTDYGRLEIIASNITIDGRGVVLDGGTAKPNQRQSTAISSVGQKNVTLKNITARGWETGLHVADADGWEIINCDFSDNFHDPEFGWGENGRRGGMVFERVNNSVVSRCKANRVWDACVLVDSDGNKISNSDFSHASNTCLKLWHSCRNEIKNNNLSYGIRIRPDEVHARDSTGVLIENGSNRNEFVSNDCTHGGDGIFIRVLNGWVSTDNRFIDNDCSYANNNGFECWAPRNTFISNKANHCSYGFWLGGSDKTRLIENEVSFNGKPDGFHNSPHLPNNGHAGIVFMFGPSSHILAYGNRCFDNEGAGIALIGDLQSKGEKWKAFHWVIAGNHLSRNRWGVFVQHADWVTLVRNNFLQNSMSDLNVRENVRRLSTRSSDPSGFIGNDLELDTPTWYSGTFGELTLLGPTSCTVGEEVHFQLDTADGSFSKFEWIIGQSDLLVRKDEFVRTNESPPFRATSNPESDANGVEQGSSTASSAASRASATFENPGFYRIGVTASGTSGIDLAYKDFYVVSQEAELAATTDAWTFQPEDGLECHFHSDSANALVGEDSTRISVSPYHGGIVRFMYPSSRNAAISLKGKSKLSFWIKANNPNLPGWQSNNPEVTLYDANDRQLRIVPTRDLMQEQAYNEAREGWRLLSVPLADSPNWTYEGDQLSSIDYFTLGFDSWGGDPLEIWLDGIILE